MRTRPLGTAGYGPDAEALARRYTSTTFEAVHASILPWLPSSPGRVLDIGAGSGRDAAALARRGHHVVAVEPTDELRRIGRRSHPGVDIEWVDDALPALARVRGRYDLVLMSAVWMHLDEAERVDGMRRVAELTAPGGRVAMSIRRGPVPEGRRMFAVPVAETLALAGRSALFPVHRGEEPDHLGRADVHWDTLVLRAEPPAPEGQ
ncbi:MULTISPECIES: class I SAM-dependent methyltransferase [unclassified Embleya]|uniref:class I SAM-dependent methyltransferase n=1 Tax=unclassified Embleya TaxID=2699296 RepID=UPI0036CAB8FB